MKFDLHDTIGIIFGIGEIARLAEAAGDFPASSSSMARKSFWAGGSRSGKIATSATRK